MPQEINETIIYIRLPSGTINHCIQYLWRSTRITDQYFFCIVDMAISHENKAIFTEVRQMLLFR